MIGKEGSPTVTKTTSYWRCGVGLGGGDIAARNVKPSSLCLWSVRVCGTFLESGANFAFWFKHDYNCKAFCFQVRKLSGCLLPLPVGVLGLSKRCGSFPPPINWRLSLTLFSPHSPHRRYKEQEFPWDSPCNIHLLIWAVGGYRLSCFTCNV